MLQIACMIELRFIKHWGHFFIIHGKLCITKENIVSSSKVFLHLLELPFSSLNGCVLLCNFFPET